MFKFLAIFFVASAVDLVSAGGNNNCAKIITRVEVITREYEAKISTQQTNCAKELAVFAENLLLQDITRTKFKYAILPGMNECDITYS